jgi:predicted RNA-binding protein YlqC (UPF0109 family)
MREFLEYVVKGLVQRPEEISVKPVEKGGMTIFELRMSPGDVGRIIGREGIAITSIRSLLAAGSAKKGLRCTLEIIEDRPG